MPRCQAILGNNKRCKRNATKDLCWQHIKIVENRKSPVWVKTDDGKMRQIIAYGPLTPDNELVPVEIPRAKPSPRAKIDKSFPPKFKQVINKNGTYDILDNGGIPFKVIVNSPKIDILKSNEKGEKYIKFKTFTSDKIFIGVSPLTPMTDFSGGHGEKENGNSILLHLTGLTYVFIGWDIYSFDALHPITYYISEVGNSSVPYPYAIDDHQNVYLMIEKKVIVVNKNKKIVDEMNGEPYNYYYEQKKNVRDIPKIKMIQKRL